MNEPASQTRWLLALIMLTLIGWGLFHAVGAYWGTPTSGRSLGRGLLVLACFAGFLGSWLVLLALRARRTSRRR